MSNYSVRFYKGCSNLDKFDEVKIKIGAKHSAADILRYIETRGEQKVVLDMTELLEEEYAVIEPGLIAGAASGMQFSVLLLGADFWAPAAAQTLREHNIPFFVLEKVNNWEKLNSFINQGVSEIYLTDELGFDIKAAANLAHANNVKVRVFPNVYQSSSLFGAEITGFFIRPEDMFLYDEYVDTYEFWGPLQKQDVLLKIYKSHKWLGPLGHIIFDSDLAVSSDRLLPYFGHTRLDCRKRCLQGRCDVCNAMLKFGLALEEYGDFYIKVDYPDYYDKNDIDILLDENIDDFNVDENFSLDNE